MQTVLSFLNKVTHAKTEEAKKLLFYNLLMELYKNDPEAKNIISEMSEGAEKPMLNIPVAGKLKTGYADTQYRRIIIEFERDITQVAKLEHAEYQLKEYLSSNWNTSGVYNYTLIATDGIRWVVYGPKPESYIGKSLIRPEELQLKKLDWITLDSTNADSFFLFIDRYLFHTEKQLPTLENIQKDFGEKSEVFMEAFGRMKIYYESIKANSDIVTAYREWEKCLSMAYGSFKASGEVFLVHTYMSVFAKILAYSVLTHDDFIDSKELHGIVKGDIFKRLNVGNFVENDFYCWITAPDHFHILTPALRRIADKISDYNFVNVKADILKGVYQELIDLETRRLLGEYYTPDWLCTCITQHFNIPKSARIIDPACGSGSFLMAAIQKLKGDYPDITVEELATQVVGIDIHPLSVQIAKTTILVGLGDLLKSVRKPIQIRVYLSNSIITQEENVNLFGKEFQVKVNNTSYFLPTGIFDDPNLFDRAVSVADELAEESQNGPLENPRTLTAAIRKHRPDANAILIDKFYDLYQGLKEAKESKQDSIWKFVLQNSYKPYFLKGQFDYVIGNPPWLTYSSVCNTEYQTQLKQLAQRYDLIPDKKANMPHLEIAAIFLSHATSYFLAEGGRLGFVLPRSFISAEHHDNTRSGRAKGFVLTEVWDLQQVSPLFRVPSCVFFAGKTNISKTIPATGIEGKIVLGKLKTHNAVWDEVKCRLTIKTTKWYYSKLKKASALTNNIITNVQDINFYKKHFRQGATLVPRNFYFIQLERDAPSDWSDRLISIRSDEENDKDAKMPWKALKLNGSVSTNYLFRTAVARNIIPFGLINPQLVVLPITINKQKKIELSTSVQIKEEGELETAKWFKRVECLWEQNKTENSRNMSAFDRINYQRGLTEQNINMRYLIVYTASGQDANATVVDRKKLDLSFFVESATYAYYTNSEEEAYYLAAFFNANYPNRQIKEFQAKGLFGPRHVHKKILDVPLPQFIATNKLHQELASVSHACTKEANRYILENQLEHKKYNVGKVRTAIRKLLAPQLVEIDQLLSLATKL